jgi:hypothetical protein
MAGVWGIMLIPSGKLFSEKTKTIIIESLPEARNVFSKEYNYALDNKHHYMLCKGSRYYDDEKIIRVIESKFEESYFIVNKNKCLNDVLLGACSADYYYTYEKEWY